MAYGRRSLYIHRQLMQTGLPFIQANILLTQLMEDLDHLVQAHTDIDVEMKVEGDRLLQQARLIALGLVTVLGLVIALTISWSIDGSLSRSSDCR